MNIETLANHLAGAGLGLVIGQSIFAGEMPATCSTGVLLMEPYHGTPIDHEKPGMVHAEFRVVVRHTDRPAGAALAKQLVSLLTIYGETQIGTDMLVKQCLPINQPRPYRRSAGAFWEFEVDVAISYVDLSA